MLSIYTKRDFLVSIYFLNHARGEHIVSDRVIKIHGKFWIVCSATQQNSVISWAPTQILQISLDLLVPILLFKNLLNTLNGKRKAVPIWGIEKLNIYFVGLLLARAHEHFHYWRWWRELCSTNLCRAHDHVDEYVGR